MEAQLLPVYIIHSPSLSERRSHVEREMRSAGIDQFEWITEFEVADITPAVESRWFATRCSLSQGQKSCALKHLRAHQWISARNQDAALVFEDDVFLSGGFHARLDRLLKESEEWPQPHVVHLGSATNFYTPAHQLRPGKMLYRGSRNRNAEAYLIGHLPASLRLQWVEIHKLDDPIDIAFNSADVAMSIGVIWTEPPLAEQGSLNGKFKSSLDPKQRSQVLQSLQFPIQKFRRRYFKRWMYAISSRISLYQSREPSSLDQE